MLRAGRFWSAVTVTEAVAVQLLRVLVTTSMYVPTAPAVDSASVVLPIIVPVSVDHRYVKFDPLLLADPSSGTGSNAQLIWAGATAMAVGRDASKLTVIESFAEQPLERFVTVKM